MFNINNIITKSLNESYKPNMYFGNVRKNNIYINKLINLIREGVDTTINNENDVTQLVSPSVKFTINDDDSYLNVFDSLNKEYVNKRRDCDNLFNSLNNIHNEFSNKYARMIAEINILVNKTTSFSGEIPVYNFNKPVFVSFRPIIMNIIETYQKIMKSDLDRAEVTDQLPIMIHEIFQPNSIEILLSQLLSDHINNDLFSSTDIDNFMSKLMMSYETAEGFLLNKESANNILEKLPTLYRPNENSIITTEYSEIINYIDSLVRGVTVISDKSSLDNTMLSIKFFINLNELLYTLLKIETQSLCVRADIITQYLNNIKSVITTSSNNEKPDVLPIRVVGDTIDPSVHLEFYSLMLEERILRNELYQFKEGVVGSVRDFISSLFNKIRKFISDVFKGLSEALTDHIKLINENKELILANQIRIPLTGAYIYDNRFFNVDFIKEGVENISSENGGNIIKTMNADGFDASVLPSLPDYIDKFIDKIESNVKNQDGYKELTSQQKVKALCRGGVRPADYSAEQVAGIFSQSGFMDTTLNIITNHESFSKGVNDLLTKMQNEINKTIEEMEKKYQTQFGIDPSKDDKNITVREYDDNGNISRSETYDKNGNLVTNNNQNAQTASYYMINNIFDTPSVFREEPQQQGQNNQNTGGNNNNNKPGEVSNGAGGSLKATADATREKLKEKNQDKRKQLNKVIDKVCRDSIGATNIVITTIMSSFKEYQTAMYRILSRHVSDIKAQQKNN